MILFYPDDLLDFKISMIHVQHFCCIPCQFKSSLYHHLALWGISIPLLSEDKTFGQIMMPSCREQYLYRQGTIISFAKDQLSEKNISIVKEHHAYCQAGTVQFKQKRHLQLLVFQMYCSLYCFVKNSKL